MVSLIFDNHSIAGSAVSNPENVLMSPIVMWSDIIKGSKYVEEIFVVCLDNTATEYEALVSAVHSECIHVIPLSQLSNEDLSRECVFL